MLEIAYEGHQGQVKTKQLWFPGMDDQCKKFASICIYCQANTLKTHREPLKMTELPEGPWKRVTRGPYRETNRCTSLETRIGVELLREPRSNREKHRGQGSDLSTLGSANRGPKPT